MTTIATPPSRLNIFIGRVVDGMHTYKGTFTGTVVLIRDGYDAIDEDDPRIAGRLTCIPLRCRTKFDPLAINNIGRPGASVVDLDPARVEAAVAKLLAAWGALPVQDNSGRFPHLATAPGVLRI